MPRLKGLMIESHSKNFPFMSLGCLQSLVSSCQGLPGDMHMMTSLQSLTMGTAVPMNRLHLDSLTALQRIREVKIMCYQAEDNETFAGLARLHRRGIFALQTECPNYVLRG